VIAPAAGGHAGAEGRAGAMKASRRRATPGRGDARRVRAELAARLGERRRELEAAVLARVRAVADPAEVEDPTYTEGLGAAIAAALDYGLEALEASEERPAPIPVALLAQARLAARNRVGIDVVLRRYLAGYTLLGDLLVSEAAELEAGGAALKGMLRAHAAALDRLLAEVSEEHARERRPSPASAERRRLGLARRLLAGEPSDASELRYPFEGHHLGLLCRGPGAEDLVRELAAAADRSLLAVRPDAETLWAWLGGTRELDPAQLASLAAERVPEGAVIALGESAEALPGWRLTHRQAAAALPVAMRGPEPVIRYADVALLAATLRDELLTTTLRCLYMEPLETERDGGKVLRGTLRAYFAAHRNVSSAAVGLGVSRKTVNSRLRVVERLLARSLDDCAIELQLALLTRRWLRGSKARSPIAGVKDQHSLTVNRSHSV
jgi:hypothetical protein